MPGSGQGVESMDTHPRGQQIHHFFLNSYNFSKSQFPQRQGRENVENDPSMLTI